MSHYMISHNGFGNDNRSIGMSENSLGASEFSEVPITAPLLVPGAFAQHHCHATGIGDAREGQAGADKARHD